MNDQIVARYENRLELSGLRYGIIEVTTLCQCACPGCYMVSRNALNRESMTLPQAIRVLDLCRDYTGRELESMDILGGEPLLWPYLQEYIDVLLSRGIIPWVFTNMLAITPQMADWLHCRGVNITGKLNINPDNPNQYALQAKMLDRNINFVKKLIRAISVIKSAGYGKPKFRLENLIRQDNIDVVPDYYRWCLENNIGIDLELMGSGEAIGPAYWAIAPTPRQIAQMIEKIQTVRLEFGNTLADVLMPHVFGACRFYDKGLYFAVDGSIRACSNSTITLANALNPEPVKKAYQSSLIRNRLALTQDNVGEPCHSCVKWAKCRGGCRATVEGMGDPFGGYTLCPIPYL